MSKSGIDTIFDKSFFEVQQEIKAIDDGLKSVQTFSLFSFLKPEWQDKLSTDPKSIEHFKAIVEDEFKHKSFFDFFKNHFQRNNLINFYKHVAKMKYFHDSATESNSHYIAEFCLLNNGGFFLINLAMLVTLKRYSQKFGIGDFIFCQIQTDEAAHSILCRQMLQSYLHYMMKKRFLQIVVLFSELGHAT
jgi:hypothetical protein